MSPNADDFRSIAAAERSGGLVRELFRFLAATRKWWLLPILITLLLLGVLVFLSGTAASPFIYTLF